MSVIATAVRHLMAAGVTGDALIEAIAELEADVRAEPKPRSAGAIRTERWRERKRHEASQVTDGDVCDGGDAAPSLSRPPNEINSNPPTHTHPEITTPRAREAFPRPEWADPLVWADFLKNRAKKRLANTATAYRQFLRDIDKLSNDEWPPGRLLEAIVARGWAAAYDPREETARNDRPNRQHPQHQRASVREIAERVAAGYSGTGDGSAQLLPGPRAAGGYG